MKTRNMFAITAGVFGYCRFLAVSPRAFFAFVGAEEAYGRATEESDKW